jgi:uncharacterized protein YlxP (DUF503 family)
LHIGVCRLALRLPSAHSLKDKRQVAQSLASRMRNQFNVAVAEAADDQRWQSLTLVVCCVSNDASHANEVLSKVADFVVQSRPDLELMDYATEIISGV